MKKLVPALAFVLALTGCVNLGKQPDLPAVVYYVLTDAAPASPVISKDAGSSRAEVRGAQPVPTLLVLDTTSGSFYDTDQLVFSRSADTRGLYQFARWTERPGKRFADLMRARLQHRGDWHVSAAAGHVRGDLLLDTELVEFYHDASSQPGQIRLVLRAELVDLKQRKPLGRRVFEQQVPLATYDAAGAAQASSVAAGRLLDELTAWLANTR